METIRTNIELDKQLVEELMESTGTRTKRQLVHDGLLALQRERARLQFAALKGQLTSWEGDLTAERKER